MNSLHGIIFQVMEKTHMSWDEILWKRSWLNIQWMMADAPRVVYGKKKKTATEVSAAEMRALKRKKRNG